VPSPLTPAVIDGVVPTVFNQICATFKMLKALGPIIQTFVHWAFTSTGEATPEFKALFASIGVPTGGLIDWPIGGSLPDGFLSANGQTVSRVVYADLFSVIGTFYGAGDGVTTFALPDFTDRFRVGASGVVGVGSEGGNATVSLIEANNGPHTHRAVAAAQGVNAYNTIWGSSPDLSKTGKVYPSDHGLTNIATEEVPIATTLESSGAGTAFAILPPFVATIVLIKT
jgi:microcystin-dependent protein